MNNGFLFVTRAGRWITSEHELAAVWMPYLHATAASNLATMRAARRLGTPLPRIFTQQIVWHSDPPGPQVLYGVLDVLEQGWGDCKAFCCIRLAELWDEGFTGAQPRIIWVDPRRLPPGVGPQMHAQVRHQPECGCVLCKHQPKKVRRDGLIEESSRMLGM